MEISQKSELENKVGETKVIHLCQKHRFVCRSV